MRRRYHRDDNGVPRPYGKFALTLFLLLPSFSVTAGSWKVEPRLSLKETLTDNLRLTATNEQREALTQVIPGVSVQQKAGRSTLNLNYALQGLIYSNLPEYNNVYHNLNTNARQQLVPENLSVAERVSVSQQIKDPRLSVPSDNINPGNITNVVSYSVAPAARGRIGGVVDSSINYRYGQVYYLNTDAASDSAQNDVTVSLKDARHGTRLTWDLYYDKSVTDRLEGANSHYESSEASLRYNLIQGWYTYAVGGKENNDIPTNRTIQNGSYWRAGLGWAPGPEFSLQASYGALSKEASLSWVPLTRTSLMVRYLNQDVGVNPGITWSGSFQHRTPNTTWRASYSEEAVNVQRLELAGQRLFVLVDKDGNLIRDPTTGLPIFGLENNFTITDQDFIRKHGSVGASVKSAFTVSGVNLFDEKREYQISGGSERQKGISGTINWKFASRTSLRISGRLSRWSYDINSEPYRLEIENVGMVRSIGSDFTGSLSYARTARNSDDQTQNYVEHRIEATLIKHW